MAYRRIALVGQDYPYAPDAVSASPAGFAAQLTWIGRNFNAIALDDLIDLVLEGRRLPERSLLVTFDGGYADVADVALPALRARRVPAVVFAITGAMGARTSMYWDECASLVRRTPLSRLHHPTLGSIDLGDAQARGSAHRALVGWLERLAAGERDRSLADLQTLLQAEPAPSARPLLLGWERVPELLALGVVIQPHSVSYPILAALDDAEILEEVEESAREVELRTGRASAAFAYPGGGPGDHDERAVQALRGARVKLAFTRRPGPVTLKELLRDPYAIPRVTVHHRDGLGAFALKVAGFGRSTRRLRALARATGRSRLRDAGDGW